MKDKVAVVTGSSSGIGRAVAVRLATSGFDVIVHACRNKLGAEDVAESIRQIGREAYVLIADFACSESIDNFVQECWNWQAGVEVWVNNAGADVLTGNASDWSFDQKLQHVLQVDLVGTMLLSRAIGQKMVGTCKMVETCKERIDDRSPFCIVNVGWDQAAQGMAGDSGEMFAASKGAIMAFSKSLAQSLAPYVRVNCVAPGWIQTAWGEQASNEWQSRAKADSLLSRWGSVDDVASVVDFLCSPAAEFVNGQVVDINGGFQFSR